MDNLYSEIGKAAKTENRDTLAAMVEMLDKFKYSGKYDDLLKVFNSVNVSFGRRNLEDYDTGSYDPDTRTLTIRPTENARNMLASLVHELTHVRHRDALDNPPELKFFNEPSRRARRAHFAKWKVDDGSPEAKAFLSDYEDYKPMGTYGGDSEIIARIQEALTTESPASLPWASLLLNHKDFVKNLFLRTMDDYVEDREVTDAAFKKLGRERIKPIVSERPFDRMLKEIVKYESFGE